jgi:hypothetical protein
MITAATVFFIAIFAGLAFLAIMILALRYFVKRGQR